MIGHDAQPRPIDDDGHDLIIVSDFHMSEGSDRATGQWDFREDFLQDEAFERFMSYLIQQPPPNGRTWRLVILGDFIEYLQINVEGLQDVYGYRGMTVPQPYDRHRSEEEAVWKTQQVMVGHAGVFAALGRFVTAGHRITFVPGNHDIELAWPRVQDEIREGIALRLEQVGDPAFNALIEFEPWFFYRRGIVYADHGHQFDRMNSNDRQLNPRNLDDTEQFDLPLGSWLVYHAYNRIEKIDAVADNVKPMSAYLRWALAHRGYTAAALISRAIWSYKLVSKGYPKRTRSVAIERRQTYQASEAFRTYTASKRPLPDDVTTSIDNVHEFYHGRTWLSMVLGPLVWAIVPAVLIAVIALVSWTMVAWHAGNEFESILSLDGKDGWLFMIIGFVATFVTGLVALVAGVRQFAALASDLWRAIRRNPSEHYLIKTARTLHGEVFSEGFQARAYVFGHNHQPAVVNMGGGTAGSERLYINTGTWTPIINTSWRLLGQRDTLTFALITVDLNGDPGLEVQASLMVWNDLALRIEPFRDLAGPSESLDMAPPITEMAEMSQASAD